MFPEQAYSVTMPSGACRLRWPTYKAKDEHWISRLWFETAYHTQLYCDEAVCRNEITKATSATARSRLIWSFALGEVDHERNLSQRVKEKRDALGSSYFTFPLLFQGASAYICYSVSMGVRISPAELLPCFYMVYRVIHRRKRHTAEVLTIKPLSNRWLEIFLTIARIWTWIFQFKLCLKRILSVSKFCMVWSEIEFPIILWACKAIKSI